MPIPRKRVFGAGMAIVLLSVCLFVYLARQSGELDLFDRLVSLGRCYPYDANRVLSIKEKVLAEDLMRQIDHGNWLKSEGNPIIRYDLSGWDEFDIESPACLFTDDQFVLFYSGICDGAGGKYGIGRAVGDKYDTLAREPCFPVLGNGSRSEWDFDGVGVNCVLQTNEEYKYRLYYQATNRYENPFVRMGVAFSNDLVNWVKYSGNPILGNSTTGVGICDCTVIKENGKYRMWYLDYAVKYEDDKISLWQAESMDGLKWENLTMCKFYPSYEFWNIAVHHELFDVIKIGHIYVMAVEGSDFSISRGSFSIGFAHSYDGVNWYWSGYNPKLTPTKAEGSWEKIHNIHPTIAIIKKSEAEWLFVCYYCGIDGTSWDRRGQIGVVTLTLNVTSK